MSTKSIFRPVLAVVFLLAAFAPGLADEAAERSFTLKILPLLKEKCQGCHGDDKADIKGEIQRTHSRRLATWWRIRNAGDGSGQAQPGHVD